MDDQHVPYIVPCECGGKEDVRWLTLTDHQGKGLMVSGFHPFHFDVHRNSVQDYAQAKHTIDLKFRDQIWLNIDCIHSGVGGDNGWTRNIHPEFQVKPGRYHYTLTIKPFIK